MMLKHARKKMKIFRRALVQKQTVHQTIEGVIDIVDDERVVGWAYDTAAPDRALLIKIVIDGLDNPIIALANIDRQDLRNAGKGNGQHGFDVSIKGLASIGSRIRIYTLEAGRELHGSPVRINLAELAAQSPAASNCLRIEAYEAQRLLIPTCSAKEESRANITNITYRTRSQPDVLFETESPNIDPEGLITRYVNFEHHRFKQDQHSSLTGNLGERLRILHWYLASYGSHRALPLPLSKQQIEFLNSPIPIIGLRYEVSVAAYSFIFNEHSMSYDLRNEAALQEATFWWCVQRSPLIAPNGDLITDQQVSLLTKNDGRDTYQTYPINYFLRRLWELDPSLTTLDLKSAVSRAVLTAVVMLRCAERPYYARFLPRSSVSALLAPHTRQANESFSNDFHQLISQTLNDFVEYDTSGRVDSKQFAKKLVEQLNAHLNRNGYAFSRTTRSQNSEMNAGLCFKPDPSIIVEARSGLEVGVAVIGPTRATSGLGQATRLSIDVLDKAGQDISILDFGLDNPAPVGFTSAVRTRKLTTPKQINLFHLNAESIPLAFAYLDSNVYRHSYNIGYFFWELDQLPRCHSLALSMLDEIWVSSEYNREIYAKFAAVPVINVGMAVEALPEFSSTTRDRFGLDEQTFYFLATFDSFSFVERKNPLGVLAAFQHAFPAGGSERVGLILKTQNRTRVDDPHQVRVWQAIDDIVTRDPRIRIIDETFSYNDLLAFKKLCNAYVSLHRSEGWGFGLIEAMQLGIPVIATAYSGNLEFCRTETAWLVDYELVTPNQNEYIFVERGSRWAHPSIESAAAMMRLVFSSPTEVSQRCDEARRVVHKEFGLAAIANRYQARLDVIKDIISGQ
ncbi:group 1 glycosyl transferase [Methylobacterium sp. DM1]|nr:group 1 glycosyl transferase [Methylobacterium sp. DM1]